MNTTKANIMIDIFMGNEMVNELLMSRPNGGVIFVSKLSYHKDWNWLMDVVEKIEMLGYVFFIHGNKCEVNGTGNFQGTLKLTKKESTYQSVVQFIEWYNNNK